jgi:hypothetical protein
MGGQSESTKLQERGIWRTKRGELEFIGRVKQVRKCGEMVFKGADMQATTTSQGGVSSSKL